jgi:beta-galactosidase
MALSNAEQVKLYLNGKLIQDSKVDKYDMNTWKVPYKPGKLEAVGYKGGKEVSRFAVETTSAPVRLELIPDRTAIAGEGWDAVPITVRALDAKGRPVETANIPVRFELTGPGNIIGHGNGDATSHEPEKGNIRNLFNGLAQVILQSNANSSGKLSLKATSPGLKDAVVNISVKASQQIPVVPTPSPALILDKWVVSKVTPERPDPNQAIANFDMNSWEPTTTGSLRSLSNGKFLIYRSSFTPYADQQALGSVLLLTQITGKAEVYINKKLVATKGHLHTDDITITLPPGKGEQTISVLIEGEPGKNVGLGGIVNVQ